MSEVPGDICLNEGDWSPMFVCDLCVNDCKSKGLPMWSFDSDEELVAHIANLFNTYVRCDPATLTPAALVLRNQLIGASVGKQP